MCNDRNREDTYIIEVLTCSFTKTAVFNGVRIVCTYLSSLIGYMPTRQWGNTLVSLLIECSIENHTAEEANPTLYLAYVAPDNVPYWCIEACVRRA